LEVILSLAILVMSLSALGLLINMGTEHEMNTRLANAGTRLAQSKLAEIEAGIEPLEDGSGTFDTDTDWTWEKKAVDQGKNLWLVTVTVRREMASRSFEMSLGQYILHPEVRGSASKRSRPSSTTTTSDGGSP
jgi:hypothetical protein